jgi:carbonic anhydrase
LQKLRSHPWIPKEVAVRGFVYDVSNGKLREIRGN